MNRLVKIKDLKTGKIYIVACLSQDNYDSLSKKKRCKIEQERDFTNFETLRNWCNNHNILPY